MTRYLLLLILCVTALIVAMEALHSPDANPAKALFGKALDAVGLGSIAPGAPARGAAGKGAPAAAASDASDASAPAAAAREPHFSSDPPARAPVSNLYAGGDAAQRERYRAALQELTVEACTSKGRFTVKTPASNGAQTLVNGGSLAFSGGLVLSLRLVDYRTCRIALYDGAQKVGDTAAF